MSSKFELTIDTNYVKDWGVPQAIRELFQNSVDEEVQNPDNKSYFSYDKETQTLIIGNKQSILNIESLLLGVTTKTNDKHTIGQFGEGYKIATMVLLRTGHPITFYNYGAREVWTTRLVKSRRYNGRLVPTFFVDKNFFWQSTPDNNLTIKVENITEGEYEKICDFILCLQPDIGETMDCDSYGKILLDARYKGNVYVSGLFVCKNDRINYGYNITPEYLQLDRDRQTVSDFDLLWTTSRMWSLHKETQVFKDLLYSKHPDDVAYIDVMVSISNFQEDFMQDFIDRYGPNTIPVTNQEEYDLVKERGGNPVFVTKPVGACFKNMFNDFILNEKKTESQSCYDALKDWYNSLQDEVEVPLGLDMEFKNILETFYDKLI